MASAGASAAAVIGLAQSPYGFVQELAHNQDLHPSPVDLLSASRVAAATLAIGVVNFRETFHFSRSLDPHGPELASGP